MGALLTAAARALPRCRFLALLLAFASLFLLSACAGPLPLLQRPAAGGPQWPEPPFPPRIEWVKSVDSPESAGIGKSFWKRALDFFAGPDRHMIVRPYGVLYDAAGRLLIADPGSGTVHLMDTAKARYLRLSAPGGVPFDSPIGLAEDAAGKLYITDSGAETVYRYDFDTGAMEPFVQQLERPTGIAFNRANGLIYISETGAGRVIGVDLTGTLRHSFGHDPPPGQPALNLPTDLATDAKGQLYVNDPLNYKIRVFTPEGVQVSQFGAMGDSRGELNKPKGIAVDRDGRVFVADSLLDAVQIFDDEGRFLYSFGAAGGENGAFWMPSGLYLRDNYIFVADTYNQRVQVFRYLPEGDDNGAASNGK